MHDLPPALARELLRYGALQIGALGAHILGSKLLRAHTAGGGGGNWWLSGGITSGQCVCAYNAKGAASYAASKSNLNNPGTNDATDGVVPTWANGVGWTFNGSSQFVRSGGGNVGTTNWSFAVQYTGLTGGAVCGTRDGNGNYWMTIPDNGTGVNYYYGNQVQVTPVLDNGNIIIAGGHGYRNGVSEVATLSNLLQFGTFPMFIGACNNENAGDIFHAAVTVVAFAMYNVVIPSASALQSAMAAL